MASIFKTLVTTGLSALTDASPLRTARTWVRNGEKGALHANVHCYKIKEWESRRVQMTYEEAAGKRTCGSCCDANALPSSLVRPLRAVHDAERTLKALLEQTGQAKYAQDLGKLLDLKARIDAEFAALNDNDRDLIAAAIEDLGNRTGEANKAIETLREQLKGGIVPWAAARLMRKDGDTVAQIPGVESGDANLFGTAVEDYESTEQIKVLYKTWVNARRNGRDNAEHATLGLLAETELTGIEQLDFPVAAVEAASLKDLVRTSWQIHCRKRLEHGLFPIWEERWQDYTSRTAPTTVGLRSDPRLDATRGLFAVLPSHGNVALMPEVVAEWVLRSEARYGEQNAEAAEACDADLLQTISVLWDPGDRTSAMHELAAAVEAARRL